MTQLWSPLFITDLICFNLVSLSLSQEAHTHMNLGAILHMNNKLESAERSYLRALEIEPGHETTSQNLKKLRTLMNKRKIGSK